MQLDMLALIMKCAYGSTSCFHKYYDQYVFDNHDDKAGSHTVLI